MTYNVQPGPGRGTYILILWLPREERMAVGRLGTFTFPAGTYVYVGSAMGPGGLAGRLRHHRRPVTRPHWHVDYLRQRGVELREVWWVEDDTPYEHEWARQLAQTAGVTIPAPRFGASDCRCVSHLFHCRVWAGDVTASVTGGWHVGAVTDRVSPTPPVESVLWV